MSNLQWKMQRDGGWMAMRGQHVVGLVVERYDGVVVYQVNAVHTKWITKAYDEVKSIASAKRALTRAWNDWLNAFGLQAVPAENGKSDINEAGSP